MEVFRISTTKFAKQLTSSGRANRWNHDNEYVIYTGSSRSLSTLELVVHVNKAKPSLTYKVMVIGISDDDKFYNQIRTDQLPNNWRTTDAYSQLQLIGSDWYKNNSSLVLKVPSAIIPFEHNYIINSNHPDFKKNVKLVRLEDYYWDDRLFPEIK